MRFASVAGVVLLPLVGLVACGGASRRGATNAPAPEAVSDAGDPAAAADAPATDPLAAAPVVLTGTHGPLGSTWLPNGHLLIATPSEMLEIDPEKPDDAWKVHPPIVPTPTALVGTGGGNRFVVIDQGGVTLWDATKLEPMKRIAGPRRENENVGVFGPWPVAISDDGARVIVVPPGDGKYDFDAPTLIDGKTGDVVKAIPVEDSDQMLPPELVTLSEDGKTAGFSSNMGAVVLDVDSGKRIVKRTMVRGYSRANGYTSEISEAHGGRVFFTDRNGLQVIDATSGKLLKKTRDARLMSALSISLDLDAGQMYGNGYAWSFDKGAITRAPDSPDVAPDSIWRAPLHVQRRADGHFSIRTMGGMLSVQDTQGKTVLRFGETSDRTYSWARELQLFAGAAHYRSDRLTPADDVAFARAAKARPKLPNGQTNVTWSQTNAFALVAKRPKATLMIWDAEGHEVARIPVTANTIAAASGAVAIVDGAAAMLRCDAKGCAPVGGTYASMSAFEDPWFATQRGKDGATLTNIATKETRPLPPACSAAIGIVPPTPDILCSPAGYTWMRESPAEGERPLPLPDIRGTFARGAFVGAIDGRLYFDLGRDDLGLARAYRFDPARKIGAQMYISAHAGVVQFDDGAVERFGDQDEAARTIRCRADAGWIPYSACASKWDAPGRFEDPKR